MVTVRKAVSASKKRPAKRAAAANAAVVLRREVGKPRNINTVAVDKLKCVVAWAKADEATRVRVVGQLTTALVTLVRGPSFAEVKSSAWNSDPAFTPMVSLGKAIDRLIRGRLPLPEAMLCNLAEIAAQRADFSTLRLVAQLEHFAKQHVIGPQLDLAIAGLIERNGWDKDLIARLWALIAPVKDLATQRDAARERELLATSRDAVGRMVYADWLEEHGDHRGAAFLRAVAAGADTDALALLVDPAWRNAVTR